MPWTAEEHKRFLLGLSALGKGDWRGISRHYVQTRTPTQVASHAQKYFIRQTNTGNKRKRRTSLFDTTLESIPEANGGAALAAAASNGSAEASGLTALAMNGRDAQQASVSPSSSTEQLCQQAVSSLGMPMGIMPVGILAASQAAANGTAGAGQPGANGAGAAAGAGAGARDFAAFPAAMAGAMPMLGSLGVLPQFPCVDPNNLALLSMMFSMQQQQQGGGAAAAAAAMAAGAAQAQPGQPQAQRTGGLAAQVFRPLAVRYSNKEVLEFKKEWNGSFARNDTEGKEENKLRKHIRKVVKQTQVGKVSEPEQKQVQFPSQDLTSVSNLSANTFIS